MSALTGDWAGETLGAVPVPVAAEPVVTGDDGDADVVPAAADGVVVLEELDEEALALSDEVDADVLEGVGAAVVVAREAAEASHCQSEAPPGADVNSPSMPTGAEELEVDGRGELLVELALR